MRAASHDLQLKIILLYQKLALGTSCQSGIKTICVAFVFVVTSAALLEKKRPGLSVRLFPAQVREISQ